MKKIGFLLSGAGSTLQNLIHFQQQGRLKGEIVVVISSKADVPGITIARNNHIPVATIEYANYKTRLSQYSTEITAVLKQYGCDLVVMGGFLSFYEIPPEFENKVVNIHPSLIPAFSGAGCYGRKLYETILEHGVKITGCTVHLVNNQYDSGAILAQAAVPVLDQDTPDTLAARVSEKEKELYPEVINDLLCGKYCIKGRRALRN